MKYVVGALVALLIIGGGAWYYLDKSDTAFSIVVDNPRGAAAYTQSDTVMVKWHTYNLEDVSSERQKDIRVGLFLVKADSNNMDAALYDVARDIPFSEKGEYEWHVADDIKPGDYKLRVGLYGVGSGTGDSLWGLSYLSDAFSVSE